MKQKIFLFLIIFSIISNLVLASTVKTKKSDFSVWLYEVGAYDLFLDSLDNKDLNNENYFIYYLNSLFKVKEYEKIKEEIATNQNIIEQFSPENKAYIYLTLARVLRTQNNYLDSINTYLKLIKILPLKEAIKILSTEKNLEVLFEVVLLDTLWKSNLDKDKEKDFFHLLEFGLKIWPKNYLFKKLQEASTNNKAYATQDISKNDELMVINYILANYLGFNDLENHFLNSIENNKLRTFLMETFNPEETKQVSTNLFRNIFSQDLNTFNTKKLDYFDNENLNIFIKELKTKNLTEGLEFIKKQLESFFLNEKIKVNLYEIYFCYLIFNSRFNEAAQIYITYFKDKNNLKLDSIAFKLGLISDLKLTNYNKYSPYFIIYLLKIMNYPFSNLTYPWAEQFLPFEPIGFYKQLAAKKSLDFSTSYHFSFLFPKSYLGQKSFLFLAKKVHSEKNNSLAWKYLQQIDPDKLDWNSKVELLKAKAGLLMELNQTEEALSTYLKLLSFAPNQLSVEKKLKLGLLAQRLNKLSLAENIFINLLAQKESLTTSLQAETLFWLAETYQMQGLEQEALKKYLELAYSYPKENIWAVTALYRAGQLCEKNKNYSLAKTLYSLVLKKAERKSQKEAAKERLKFLEDRISSSANTLFLF